MSGQNRQADRILMIGPLPPATSSPSNPVGGAAVNFREMVRQLQERDIELDVVDISRPRVNLRRWRIWYSNVTTVLRVLWRAVVRIRSNRLVFLNMSAANAWSIGSCIWVVCTIYRRPMALRFFGGDFADEYYRSSYVGRWWADRTYMRCDRVFVQTRKIRGRFADRPNIRWFPNTRDVERSFVWRKQTVRKLLFVAQLRLEKGLRETVEACRHLPSYCHLSVYGPRMPNVDVATLLEGHGRATYHGVLSPQSVPRVLAQHDLLILPSYWQGEGYPGIILEAFQCGLPVISTWWNGIPEVVEHEKSGLLVEPRSASAVKYAIERLIDDSELYQALCDGARRRGEFFRSGVWYDRLAADLRCL